MGKNKRKSKTSDSNEGYQCPVGQCYDRFFTIDGIVHHTNRKHANYYPFVCRPCEYWSASARDMLEHQIRFHRAPIEVYQEDSKEDQSLLHISGFCLYNYQRFPWYALKTKNKFRKPQRQSDIGYGQVLHGEQLNLEGDPPTKKKKRAKSTEQQEGEGSSNQKTVEVEGTESKDTAEPETVIDEPIADIVPDKAKSEIPAMLGTVDRIQHYVKRVLQEEPDAKLLQVITRTVNEDKMRHFDTYPDGLGRERASNWLTFANLGQDVKIEELLEAFPDCAMIKFRSAKAEFKNTMRTEAFVYYTETEKVQEQIGKAVTVKSTNCTYHTQVASASDLRHIFDDRMARNYYPLNAECINDTPINALDGVDMSQIEQLNNDALRVLIFRALGLDQQEADNLLSAEKTAHDVKSFDDKNDKKKAQHWITVDLLKQKATLQECIDSFPNADMIKYKPFIQQKPHPLSSEVYVYYDNAYIPANMGDQPASVPHKQKHSPTYQFIDQHKLSKLVTDEAVITHYMTDPLQWNIVPLEDGYKQPEHPPEPEPAPHETETPNDKDDGHDGSKTAQATDPIEVTNTGDAAVEHVTAQSEAGDNTDTPGPDTDNAAIDTPIQGDDKETGDGTNEVNADQPIETSNVDTTDEQMIHGSDITNSSEAKIDEE